MIRRSRRKTVDRHEAVKYIQVARALRKSVRDLGTLAEEGDRYGNALAIVAIHSAIAYADALTIAFAGFKSTAGEHDKVVDTLKDALGNRMEATAARELLSIVKRKDAASYQGVYYTVEEARAVVAQLENFARWAEDLYDNRP